MAYNKEGYKVRSERIRELTARYYEPENQAKCYKRVWKKYIYPLYGIKYRSYLNYLKEEETYNIKENDLQLDLFDDYKIE